MAADPDADLPPAPPAARRSGEFPPVLTTALAAELLQVHVEYLRKMVREGKVPCHRFPEGREMRFLRDELLEWLKAQPGVDRSPGADNATEPRAATG
jgi:excisionase family DNA binding protein